MADLNTVVNTLRDNPSIWEHALTMLSAVNPVLGTIVVSIAAVFIKKNTTETVANTAVNKVTTQAIGTAKKEVESVQAAVLSDLEAKHAISTQKFDETHSLISEELKKIQIVLGKVSLAATANAAAAEENAKITAKLSHSLSVADAMKDRVERLEKATANLVRTVESKEKKNGI